MGRKRGCCRCHFLARLWGSGGHNDFGGPFTLQALHAAIDHLKQQMPITTIGIIGFGIGGLSATLLSSQRDDLSFVVSANSAYDFRRLSDENDRLRRALVENNIAMEFTLPSILIRSPMEITQGIQCPLFLLQRKQHPLVPEDEVVLFSETVNGQGGDCTVVFLEGGEHDQKISFIEVIKVAGKWLDDRLK